VWRASETFQQHGKGKVMRAARSIIRSFSTAAVLPQWSSRFFDRTAAGLKNFGIAVHEDVIHDADILSTARFEAEDLFGGSDSVWKDFETEYEDDAERPEQLLCLVKSVVTQFPVELNRRIPDLNLNDRMFSAATSQLFGSGVPDEFALDVQDPEKDPRKLSIVFFFNHASVWKQSHGGHWRFDLPSNASGIIDPVVSPISGTVLLYWAHKSPFQILSYNAPEEQKLISLHIWLHEYLKPSNS
jgi:hypothetical protein